MTMNSKQWAVLRAGAVACVLAGVVLAGFAILVNPAPKVAPVAAADPSRFDLPRLGTFGGEVTVYAHTRRATPDVLDCVLLTRTGTEQPSAKIVPVITVTGTEAIAARQEWVPVFAVKNYPAGSRLECAKAVHVPLAVSQPTTFGALAPVVKVAAGGFALGALALGAVGVVATRNPRPGSLP